LKVINFNAAFMLPDDFKGNARDALRLIADYGDELAENAGGISPNLSDMHSLSPERVKLLEDTGELLQNLLIAAVKEDCRLVASFGHGEWDEEKEEWIEHDYDGNIKREDSDDENDKD
jgi:hypothetical protein